MDMAETIQEMINNSLREVYGVRRVELLVMVQALKDANALTPDQALQVIKNTADALLKLTGSPALAEHIKELRRI